MGDGRRIRIREDRWLPYGRHEGPANHSEPRMVADILNHETHEWNPQFIAECFNADMTKEILTIPLSHSPTEDCLIWIGNKEGIYSVKATYNKIKAADDKVSKVMASTSYSPPRNLWTRLWHIQTNPKVRFFLWSICNNALPTKDNLYRRKMIPDPLCPLCGYNPETPEHLFLLCNWTKRIWSDKRLNFDTSPTRISRIEKWIADNLTVSTNFPLPKAPPSQSLLAETL